MVVSKGIRNATRSQFHVTGKQFEVVLTLRAVEVQTAKGDTIRGVTLCREAKCFVIFLIGHVGRQDGGQSDCEARSTW